MGGYLAYTEYKDSGIEWLGEVPLHWEVWKATHGFRKIGSGTTPKSDNPLYYDGDFPWITTSELREKTITDTSQKITEEALQDYSVLKLYKEGSLAIAMYGATIGRLGILGIAAAVNQACCVFAEPSVFDTKFFYYWLWMRRPILISVSTGGGQPNLSQDDLKQLRIPIPSLSEQRSIARFLDYKTAQIDALIAKKETLLKKLAEKRTALISQAVTKGCDRTVPMKDSGIEWLGQIPVHWKVIKIRYCSEFVTSGSRGWSQYFSDDGSIFLRIANVSRQGIEIKLDDVQRVLPPRDSEGERSKVIPGDVIVSITADLGSVAVIPDSFEMAYVSQHLALLRPLPDKTSGYWIAYQILSHVGKTQLLSSGYGGTKIQLSLTDIKDLWLALPPRSGQKTIEDYLDNVINTIGQMEVKVQQAIAKLKEYRTVLITNAVTGKIDVRDVKLPELAPMEVA